MGQTGLCASQTSYASANSSWTVFRLLFMGYIHSCLYYSLFYVCSSLRTQWSRRRACVDRQGTSVELATCGQGNLMGCPVGAGFVSERQVVKGSSGQQGGQGTRETRTEPN